MKMKSEKKPDLTAGAIMHVPEAISSILEIMRDPKHKDRLRAAQTILDRVYGPADKQCPPETKIVERFLKNELSASDAALLIESYGRKVPLMLNGIAQREVSRRRRSPSR